MNRLFSLLNCRIKALRYIKKKTRRSSVSHKFPPVVLNLQPSELVEVLSRKEIFATLDSSGRYQGLPFMPEMLDYCGKRFRVLKRVNKIIVEGVGIRRMRNTVILGRVACDGKFHGGCRRTCLLLWKEIWLKRVQNDL
jgi:hypothetical protein